MPEPEENLNDETPEVVAHSGDDEEQPIFDPCEKHSGGCIIN